jgi:hypothetical protein
MQHIIAMHEQGYQTGDIQRGFHKAHSVYFSLESIESIISEHRNSMVIDAPSHTPAKTDPETTGEPRSIRSRSPSTVPEVSITSSAIVESSPPSQHTPSLNIQVPLDDMSPEESLKALTTLQDSLPNLIKQFQKTVLEEKEKKEKEEQARREQEEQHRREQQEEEANALAAAIMRAKEALRKQSELLQELELKLNKRKPYVLLRLEPDF